MNGLRCVLTSEPHLSLRSGNLPSLDYDSPSSSSTSTATSHLPSSSIINPQTLLITTPSHYHPLATQPFVSSRIPSAEHIPVRLPIYLRHLSVTAWLPQLTQPLVAFDTTVMASTSATNPDTLVTLKINIEGTNRRYKLPLRDLGASTLPDKVRESVTPYTIQHEARSLPTVSLLTFVICYQLSSSSSS